MLRSPIVPSHQARRPKQSLRSFEAHDERPTVLRESYLQITRKVKHFLEVSLIENKAAFPLPICVICQMCTDLCDCYCRQGMTLTGITVFILMLFNMLIDYLTSISNKYSFLQCLLMFT